MVQPHGPQIKIWRLSTACWVSNAANTLSEPRFHGNNGYTNVPQCYVIRSLHVSPKFKETQTRILTMYREGKNCLSISVSGVSDGRWKRSQAY
jgi:hypothetical protein